MGVEPRSGIPDEVDIALDELEASEPPRFTLRQALLVVFVIAALVAGFILLYPRKSPCRGQIVYTAYGRTLERCAPHGQQQRVVFPR